MACLCAMLETFKRSPEGSALASIGLLLSFLCILKVVHMCAMFVYTQFVRGGANPRKFGEWAVVTGANSGIGESMAKQFAKRKMNVVLMARSEAALEEVAESLRSKYGVEVRVVVADLSDVSADNLETIAAELEDLDVGVLVNNAGMSYDHFDDLEAVEASRLAQLVQLNCTSLVLMTRAVLPGMKSRRRGLVLNVSSGSADMPSCPLLSAYAASKKFVDSFSVSMDYELRSFNVRCQVVAPMYVVSKLSKFRRASLFVAHPDAYAAATMRFLGRESVCWPFWSHALMLGAIKTVPACIFNNRYLVYARGMQRAFYKRQKRAQLAKKDE